MGFTCQQSGTGLPAGNRRIDTRHCNETIIIGSEITVTIVAIHGSQVRLGIDAPKHIRVLREELVEQDLAQRGVTPGGHARE